MGRRTGKRQKWKKKYVAACDTVTKPNLDEIPSTNVVKIDKLIIKTPYKLKIFLLCLVLLNKAGEHRSVVEFASFHQLPLSYSNSLIGSTWIILGVLCNVAIWKDCSWSFVSCGKIFDFGILLMICLEIIFLMIITSQPIIVIHKHKAKTILSFLKIIVNNNAVNDAFVASEPPKYL